MIQYSITMWIHQYFLQFFNIGFIIYIILVNHVISEEPHFLQSIPNITVPIGRNVNLPCAIENLGNYKMAWIHIDRQMILTIQEHVVAKLARFSVSHDDPNIWLLHINGVQREDHGHYMCQINTNPMVSQIGYLQVVVPPNINDYQSTPSSIAVRENQNVTLTCQADGYPIPKIMWKREDGLRISREHRKKAIAFEGAHLNIPKINRNDMGAYLCIATNGIPPSVSKRIIVDVDFSPMVWVSNQLVGAPSGTDVSIDCHIEAHPRAINYWVYENVMLLPTRKYGIETITNSFRTHMKLSVRRLQRNDFGTYKCISKNSLGETEGSIRIYEIPVVSTPLSIVKLQNSTAVQSNNNLRGVVLHFFAMISIHYILTA